MKRALWLLATSLIVSSAGACDDTEGSDDVASTAVATTTTSGAAGSGGQGPGGAGGMPGAGGGGGDVGGGLPLSGYGVLSGDCDELDPSELVGMSAGTVLSNAIEFPMMPYELADLSAGGQMIFNAPSENPSSKDSELFAFEVLHRCELATLLKTESDIAYDENVPGPITDLLVEIDGYKIGVSVVRAFQFMGDYTVQVALPKLNEKLADIQDSSQRVLPEDAWEKQVLSVIAEKPENAAVVVEALGLVAPAVRGDTIVVITVTNGEDAFIY